MLTIFLQNHLFFDRSEIKYGQDNSLFTRNNVVLR